MSIAQQSMAVLMLVCTAPLVGLAAYASVNLDKPGARGFLLCQIGAIGWSVALAVLAWPAQLLPVYLNTTVRMVFQFLVIFGWPLLVWEYSNRGRVRLHRALAGLLLVPALTLALAVSNPRHYLVLAAESPPNPAGISEFVLGPWYLVFISFAVIMTMLPVGYLVYELRGAHGSHRKQLLLLLGGFLVGFPGSLQTYVFRNIESVPLYVDLTPLSFAAAAVLWGLALFRYNLFGMVPVSRRTAVETMDDALVSVDASHRVVDANPAAQELFDVDQSAVGSELSEFCRAHPDVYSRYQQDDQPGELTLETDTGKRQFVLDVRPIERGQSERGSLLVLREVTRLRARERELDLLKQVLSRVFRHNMRNDIMVLQGHALAIENEDDEGQFVEHTDSILERTEAMLGHSEKATNLQSIIDADRTDAKLDLSAVVRRQVTAFRDDRPTVDIDTDLPDSAPVRCHSDIGTAITEALTNASTHFDGDLNDLRLSVTVRQDGETAVLTIGDNGPGLAETEIETLEAGEETALQHSSGVGLWMMQFIAEKSGGTLSLGESSLGGTRVAFTLPAD